MHRLLILLITLSFFSCSKQQKKEEHKKEISFSPPVTINASRPTITIIDTCPKPSIIVFPAKGSAKCTIQTPNGSKVIPIFPAAAEPLHEGEAGGYSFMQNFSTEQGLAQSTINCSYKDKIGNLWFGTSGGGLSKYDGKSFTNYTTTQGLINNLVKCIIQDNIGNLWFGTNGGVSKYDGKSFTNFTTAEGLVNNIVLSIAIDKSGNLWFSTSGGVSKYNPALKRESGGKPPTDSRTGFTNFTIAQGLASNAVRCSITDKKGNLWFGTDNGGISKYDPYKIEGAGAKFFTNYTTDQGLGANMVMCICEDKIGNIWFGTNNGGLSKYDPDIKVGPREKCFTNFNHTHGLLGDVITSITEDRSGNLWIGTGLGMSRYDPSLKTGLSTKSVTNFTPAQGLSNNAISCITEDNTGSLWIGSINGGGLSKYDGKSFTSFTIAQGLAYNKVWGIAEDKNENLWFVTSCGISKYKRKSLPAEQAGFTNFKLGGIMLNVRCIIEDKRGNIWFGSSMGVTKYDGRSFTNYTMAQGLPHNIILSIAEDKTGNLWFGTYGGGVCKYDGNRVEALEKGESIPSENLRGLKKINGKFVKSFTNFTSAQGLAGNTVKCIAEDKMGNMWFGTGGNGLSKYDGGLRSSSERGAAGRFTNYTKAQGLSNNTILNILSDKTGTLWFGTAGGGVCRYYPLAKDSNSSKPFTTFTSAQGLAENEVYGIVEDTLNNTIWFGTNLGLSGLKLNSLSSGTEGAKFENFNNNTGYPIKDLNTGALFIDSKGIIWAGTSDKLFRFDYKAVHKNTALPEVFIQSVKIQGENITWYSLKPKESNKAEINEADSLAALNEEIISNRHPLTEEQRDAMRKKFSDIKFDSITRFYPLPEKLVLPFAHNSVTFDFLAIETTRPLMVRYQYMLEGYDKDWSPVTDKTTAVFGNIYEGTYTFKLKAQSPEGIWSGPVIYSFKVLPPWYRTWWMYLSYLFIGISVIGLFFRWRTASLRKEKEILEHTVIERTKEVVEQKELIEEKQKEIVDSINYAKRIQYALLANDALLQQNLKEHFVLLQPKDIVSGDFYWAAKSPSRPPQRGGVPTHGVMDSADGNPPPSGEMEGAFYLAVCDSTGHGVPGAFMSLLNISFLNEAITEKNIKQPNEILNHVRQRLIESVSQGGAQDGMDGILLCFENGKITYAAANNAPVIVRENAVINLPADKMPIGKGEKDKSFTLHSLDAEKGDMLYFYTDGYADQFGGIKGKKFKYKQLEDLLISINQKSMEEQKQLLAAAIEKWKGNLEQVDDILISGIRI